MVLRTKYPDPASGWQPYQALITRLYRDEGRPLKEVMLTMETQHSFKATEKMYKSRIRAWGLDKKNKCREVQEILRQRARRQSLGKKSKFILRGRPVDMADIERYAKRKGLIVRSEDPSSTGLVTPEDLICFTPPPTPLPLNATFSLQNIERFLHSFNAFIDDSLQSGLWKLGKDVMGFACILDLDYPTSARDHFFLSVERGVRRYNLGDITQAYRQWRVAFYALQFIVRSRRPSQLLCLVELVANLAECKPEVATLLLRYLGDLVNDQVHPDARLSMLQSLSRLQAEDLAELTKVSYYCSRSAFSSHFSRKSFFLLDSETILTDLHDGSEQECSPQLSDLVWSWETYDLEALRATRSVMEILMVSERYGEAENIALIHVQRMQEMQYSGTVGGAFSHAYSYLTHLYFMTHEYEKAYHCTLMKVNNYFQLVKCRDDLPEDFILSSFSLLASLARKLGMDGEAGEWEQEYANLKTRTDALAESELSILKMIAEGNHDGRKRTVNHEDQETQSSPPRALQILSGTCVEDFRKCQCQTIAHAGPRIGGQQATNMHTNKNDSYQDNSPALCGDPIEAQTSTASTTEDHPHAGRVSFSNRRWVRWRALFSPMSGE